MTNKKELDILFYGPVGYTLNEYNEASNVIYKSLERLETLEYALKLKQDAIDSLNVANELLSNRINVLKQENEKLKKAIEKHLSHLEALNLKAPRLKRNDICVCLEDLIDRLKEVLDNE